MLPALVLASWWAQAEAAPVEPAPAPPIAVPAPPPAPILNDRFGITVGYARRLGDEGGRVGPRNGFALAASYERRLVPLPQGFEVGAGLEFAYAKFATHVNGNTIARPTVEASTTYSGDRVLSETSFVAMAGVSWRGRRIRPYAQLGPGVSIAYFSTPETSLRPGNLTAAQPVARAAGGLEVALTSDIALTVRVSYTHPFTHPTLNTDASSGAPATYSFLGDLFDAGAGVALGF